MYLIILAAFLTMFHDLKDGLSNMKPKVSWTRWHLFGWLSRDIVVLVLLIFLLTEHAHIIWILLIIGSRTMHTVLYNYTKFNIKKFYGNTNQPRWFKILAKLWRWLPHI